MKAVTPNCQRRLSSTAQARVWLPTEPAGSRLLPRTRSAPRTGSHRHGVCTEIAAAQPEYWPFGFSGRFTSLTPTATPCSGGNELSAAEGNCRQSAARGQLTRPRPRLSGLAPSTPRSAGRRSPALGRAPHGQGAALRREAAAKAREEEGSRAGCERGRRSRAGTGRRWRRRLQRPPAPALTFSGGGGTRNLAPPHVTRGRQSAARGAAPAPPGESRAPAPGPPRR